MKGKTQMKIIILGAISMILGFVFMFFSVFIGLCIICGTWVVVIMVGLDPIEEENHEVKG